MKYRELKEKHQSEFNEFSRQNMFYAFSNEQFDKGMRELGLEPSETNKIYSTGFGGYVLREKDKDLHKLTERLNGEMKAALQDEEFLTDAFEYELANHEYCITYDETDALDALGITVDEVLESKMMQRALLKAKKNYLAHYKEV